MLMKSAIMTFGAFPGYTKRKQRGNDLGERMLNVFKELFDQGFTRIIIIGSDCLQLNTDTLERAVALLESNSAVIGPASDGGYYLLGLTKFYPEGFRINPGVRIRFFPKL